MAVRRPLTRLALGVGMLLGASLALSDYASRVQQQVGLRPQSYLLRDPPDSKWLSWNYVGGLPSPDPSIASSCECTLRCLSDSGCFSYIYANTSGCHLSSSRGGPQAGFQSNLIAGQIRYRDGLARLGDYCQRNDECSYVVENSKCSDEICVCGDNFQPADGECAPAGEGSTVTTGAPGGSGTSTSTSSGSEGTTAPVAPDPAPTAIGPGPGMTPAGPGPTAAVTEQPTTASAATTEEPTTEEPTTEEPTTAEPTTEEPTTTTVTEEPTTAAGPALAVNVDLTAGGTKDTINPWNSACPAGYVIRGAMMPTSTNDQFDNPTQMICGKLREQDGTSVALTGSKQILHLSSDGNLKTCGSTEIATAMYSPGTTTFRLEALLCVDVGVDLSSNCNEDEPKIGTELPGPNNACVLPNAVVVGAKIKQNYQGWIEKFKCCELPANLLVT